MDVGWRLIDPWSRGESSMHLQLFGQRKRLFKAERRISKGARGGHQIFGGRVERSSPVWDGVLPGSAVVVIVGGLRGLVDGN
jgi:hypothetical protein